MNIICLVYYFIFSFHLILYCSILTICLFSQGDFDQIAGTTPVVLHDVFLILAVSVVLLLL